jgi:hypothetical protein
LGTAGARRGGQHAHFAVDARRPEGGGERRDHRLDAPFREVKQRLQAAAVGHEGHVQPGRAQEGTEGGVGGGARPRARVESKAGQGGPWPASGRS